MASAGSVSPEFQYRPDVDGLRAIAILSVVAFHAFPSLVPGGFVGVDIFFVISGFLITSLILNDLGRGRFSYATFYERRVRRLFPALIAVLVATWILGAVILLPSELMALGRHVLAAAAFAANILSYFESGYFDAPAITKPLLHLWSLGVEEQFYLVFPMLLIVLMRRAWAWSLLAVIGVASFALNVATVDHHQSFAFYLPLTRFWEFIAGALLSPGWRRASQPDRAMPTWARELGSIAGLVLLVVAIAITRPEGFPGWIAILPVLGTVLIIAAGPAAWLNRVALAKPQFVAIGLISYPLYLWHWPLIVYGRMIMQNNANPHERTTAIVAVVISFVLAYLTYRFLEQPIRGRKAPAISRRVAFRLAGGLAVVALAGLVTVKAEGFLLLYPKNVQALLTPHTFELDPFTPSEKSDGPLVITYGDSHAGHLRSGLLRLQQDHAFRLKSLAWLRCSPLDVPPRNQADCDALTQRNRHVIERDKPDILVIAAFWGFYENLPRLAGMLEEFRRMGIRRIVVIGSVPVWPRTPQIMLYDAYRRDPRRVVPDRLTGFDPRIAIVDQQVAAIAAASGVSYISARDVLCNPDGCLARVGDTAQDIVQIDRTHLGDAGSWYLVSRIAAQIFGDIAPRMADGPAKDRVQ